ncbi:hypothetical protein ALC60_04634 [Trachymyrmex zeteki]|uniref:Uncharacterized protein n=1 Tax=Mycetomoellerius zeteki TaxID=64791 RepID=A0A151X855_9HYME|nr:PREDICTED: uncharacterized protein LOC108721828 [Trachymyrmex zeteki]XP_018302103.1 PREDICTED: uncharacterized protein LOC108721828 [Trachymyrmex zeteki]KYQ56557.1 hypothetical protein ALC60_04634 [Trachymyrmex zeteki]
MLSLRRRHSRWRMFPILLFLGLICSAELTPVRLPEEISSAPSSSSTSKKKDIDFLGDFWQALLLVDPQSGFQPSLDSRRITPKSVFIAPGVLPACAEGYHADKMGRCVKSISINATAHKDFILERLKLMFSGAQAAKSDQKKSTGPLQLNIPLQLNVPASDIDPQPTEIEVEETFLKNQPVAAPIRNETYFSAGEDKTKLPSILYELKNDTTLDEEESFYFGNSNVDDIGKKLPATVPVTELVEETNDTNFSEVVDYKIPVDLKTVLNSSNVKRFDIRGSTEESVSMTKNRENSTESSPALVLLISPTKLTNVVDDLSLMQNDTAEDVVQVSNFTSNANESVITGTPDSALPPAKQMTSIPIDEQRDNETYVKDELVPETSKPTESQETDFLYDEEEGDVDYPYSTDVPDEDDSAEGEEILKHGEAGMTIPTVRDVERPDRDRHQRQQDQIAELKKLFNTLDQIVGHLNDSAPTEDKDEAESNVSSEVSIDGDFIVETEKVKDSEDESKKLFSSETKNSHVIFPDDVHDVVTVSSHGREPAEQLSMRFENEKDKELESASSSYDSPEEDSITKIRAINDKQSKEGILQKSPKDFESNVPSSSIQTTMNLDSAEDFVRFPDYVRRPQQGGYVRFPDSGEIANSIHSLNYKQNSRYSADDVGPYGGTSTKSSVPVRQKPVYHLTALSWKSDLDRVQATSSERQNQTPDLMHFWSKLPLIKDPAIYPVYQNNDQEQSYSRSFRARSSRRLNPFTETSQGNRVSTQKRKTPISV